MNLEIRGRCQGLGFHHTNKRPHLLLIDEVLRTSHGEAAPGPAVRPVLVQFRGRIGKPYPLAPAPISASPCRSCRAFAAGFHRRRISSFLRRRPFSCSGVSTRAGGTTPSGVSTWQSPGGRENERRANQACKLTPEVADDEADPDEDDRHQGVAPQGVPQPVGSRWAGGARLRERLLSLVLSTASWEATAGRLSCSCSGSRGSRSRCSSRRWGRHQLPC